MSDGIVGAQEKYDQIRYIDIKGMEVLRVNYRAPLKIPS
jgi:hypothetical protein